MPSSRLPTDLSPNAVTRTLAALRARGTEILDLTESNPTRAGIEYPPHLLDALADPQGLSYEPSPLGLLSAREAVAREYARRGLQVDPANIALTASTSEAYSFLFKLLCDSGDEMLVPRPSYPLFEHLAGLESVTARAYSLERHGSWRIDFESLREVCGARARGVFVVSPNNPTGSWLHRDDLAELSDLCAERGLALIGDEVFADYPLDAPVEGTSIEVPSSRVSVLDQREALTFALGGLSKSVGLPQLKLGWMAVHGPPSSVTSTLRAYEVIADTYLSVSTPVQVAAPALFERGAVVRDAIRRRIQRNLDTLRAKAAAFPALTVLPADGGWSIVVQVPSFRSEEALVLELLQRDRVLVHPGYFFDFPHESFVILSLLVEPGVFDAGILRVLSRAASPELVP